MKEKVPFQDEISNWECQADVIEDDKNCQVIMKPVCMMARKANLPALINIYMVMRSVNLQCVVMRTVKTQCINMWPVNPPKDMQLTKPAVPYQYKRLCSDKNCQSTKVL